MVRTMYCLKRVYNSPGFWVLELFSKYNIIYFNLLIDDDEYETFSKKSRYLYTYKLKSPDLFQNVDSESSEVYTNQSNSTSNNFYSNIKFDF